MLLAVVGASLLGFGNARIYLGAMLMYAAVCLFTASERRGANKGGEKWRNQTYE